MPILASHQLSKLNPRNSLKARLFWNTAGMVSILSLLLSLLVGYVSGKRIETTRGQSLEQLAYQMSDKLEWGMYERYKDIQILSTLDSIRQPSNTLADKRILLEQLQNLYPDYSWIGLTDTQGNILVSTGRLLEGKNASQRPWFQLAQTQTFVGDVHEALLLAKLLPNPDNEPLRFVDIAAPVKDDRGNFQGVLGAHLSWQWARDIKRSLLEVMAQPELLDIFILSKNGHVLLAPSGFEDEKLILPNNLLNTGESSGYSLDAWSDRQKYLMAFAQSKGYQSYPGLGWKVVVRQRQDLAFAPVRSLQKQVLGTGLLLASFFAVLSWFNARRISDPIVSLIVAADRLSQGEKQVKIPGVKGKDELATLSKSLTHTLNTLEDRQRALVSELQQRQQAEASLRASENRYRTLSESLEVKVEERTANLRQRQQQLETEIIERQKAEQAAEAANLAKSKFLANMSHELRTPLNAILGFARLMSRDSSLARSHQENLQIINSSGEHLLELINDVLDMSKIEAGKATLQESNFNLPSLLNDLKAMFALRAKSKGLKLNFIADESLPRYIRGDRQKLRQVLINLLSNAIKFTAEGSVTLRAEANITEAPPTLLFTVEDTGTGIAPEEIDSLFQAFAQTQTGYKAQEGTGLGLAISYHFVRLMGGDIAVSSLLERGSSFKFSLLLNALEDMEEITTPPTAKVIGLAPHQSEYRILVVEDKFNNRQLLLKLLEPIGFQVKAATNGQEAIAIWSSWSPHLIWMDMRMPVMNGDEATRKIKATTKGQATVIVALTASVFEEHKGIVLSTGCDDFVRKPFKEEEIFEKMAQYLGVRYIYEELPQLTPSKSNSSYSDRLTLADLAQMPEEWNEKLHLAATRLNEAEIEQLLGQIPQDKAFLSTALTNLVNNVRFDIIAELTQPSANNG